MPSLLVLETGQGVSTATSYVSNDEATTYFILYNNLDWVSTNVDLNEQALIQATSSVDLLYGPKYMSEKYVNARGRLLFPRIPFYDKNNKYEINIPECLKNAVCEIALMYQQGINIFPSFNSQIGISKDRSKFGDVEFETIYTSNQSADLYSDFRKIDLILYPILSTTNQNINLHR